MSAEASRWIAAGTETGRHNGASGLTRFEHVIHVVAAVGFVVQAFTGFGSLLSAGVNRGWPLLVHMIGAGVFVTGLTVSTVLWAHRCRFGDPATAGGAPLAFGQKLMYWIYTTLGLAVMLPMLSAMLPVFGTDGQGELVELHQSAALLFVAAMLVHTIVSLAARRARRSGS